MESKENETAKLVDGEPLITEELVEKYKEAVAKQQLKIDESKEDNGVITAPNKAGAGDNKQPSLGGTADSNVIGSAGAKASAKPVAKSTQKKATVALYSDRNVHWSGVGKLEKGYNIVSKEQAARWLTRNHVREATPEEVASEYGA